MTEHTAGRVGSQGSSAEDAGRRGGSVMDELTGGLFESPKDIVPPDNTPAPEPDPMAGPSILPGR